jgi:hypothetical protein
MASNNYTCNEYREEMILMALQKRLATSELTPRERQEIQEEIKRVKTSMGME